MKINFLIDSLRSTITGITKKDNNISQLIVALPIPKARKLLQITLGNPTKS